MMDIKDCNCKDCKHYQPHELKQYKNGYCNLGKEAFEVQGVLLVKEDFGCKFWEKIDYVPNADDSDWKLKQGEITIDERP